MFKDYKELDVDNLSADQAKKILEELAGEILLHNKAYFQENNPIISDAEYDLIFNLYQIISNKFPNLNPKTDLLKQVGFSPQEKFTKIVHEVPMLSLANAFDEKDVSDFVSRIKKFLNIDDFLPIFCEPKIDGLSFSAIYKNGVLTTGATRGNGNIGEDITDNIKTIQNLPHQIENAPSILEVRGEVYMSKDDFVILNQKQESEGLAKFANPRNAAAGSLRQLDHSVTKTRSLQYFIYSIGLVSHEIANSQQELLEILSSFGFVVNNLSKLAKSESEMLEFYEMLKNSRATLPYEIDGTVYKLNEFALQKRMGFIARSPRFAIAHKFPAMLGKTKLLDITVQVGRTGNLTPVAELEPLAIGGVVITRASLHNYREIIRKDIHIGDYVYLERAGDVIPYITGVDLSCRSDETKKFIFPSNCPSCGSKINYTEEDIIIRCNNGLNCPVQNHERICHFVSKNAIDIEGLGKKQVMFLTQRNMIKNPVDIFYLEERNSHSLQKLENMPGWGIKSVNNLWANIKNSSENVSLNRFIYALGIHHIGESNALLLAKEFIKAESFLQNIEELIAGNQDIYQKLNRLEGIGNKILDDMISFFSVKENLEITRELIKLLKIREYVDKAVTTTLSGKVIVFTGKLLTISRTEAKSQAELVGAKVASSVSASTDLVVAGDEAGSKLKKASELGIKIINEEEWKSLISEIIN